MGTKQIASLAVSGFTLNDAVYDVVAYHINYGNRGITEGFVHMCITDQNGKKYEGKATGCGYDKVQAAINLALKEFAAKSDILVSTIGLIKIGCRIRENLKQVF